jgi:hypothetical protein
MKLRACLIAGSTLLAALILGSIGCVSPQQTRMQAQDEPPEEDRYELKVVADVTDAVQNADPMPVAGVGLVTGLNGTGSAARPSGWRSRLERELQRKNIRNVKAVLEDKNNSLVLISGTIPAGAHRGDAFDIDISLPPGSETVSLSGGYLEECALVDYDAIAGLSMSPDTARFGQGLPRAKASGRLLVELGDSVATRSDSDDRTGLSERSDRVAKKARIWNGGRSMLERPFILAMNDKNQQARIVTHVAERINETFHGPLGSSGNGNIASPQKNGERVALAVGVPPQYKLNLQRYLRVIRMIPLNERRKPEKDAPGTPPVSTGDMLAHYKHQLEQDLLDPAHTVTAALRLEALGASSVPALKHALQSDHVLVRFCSAEALAYLDNRAGVPELAHIVAEQPYLRAYALTAMASLDEGISVAHLQDLLAHPDPEVRYGAFRALRSLDEKAYQGEIFEQGFTLHRVAAGSPPLVHVSTSRRAEIVLFGDDTDLAPGFSFLAGNFVIASAQDDTHCTISHRVGTERDYRQCSLKLSEVVETMAHMHAQYNEVLELLGKAYKIKSLSCDLRFDALPQAPTVQELAKAGVDAKRRVDLAHQGKVPEAQDRTDEELFNARNQLPATPGLFERSPFSRKLSSHDVKDEEASLDSSDRHR